MKDKKIYISLICLSTTIIYMTALMFPYLLVDDLWLIRKSSDAPSLLFISVAQGRPIFALIVKIVRVITDGGYHSHLLFFTIGLLRGLAIASISAFGVITFNWLKKWGWSSLSAFLTVIIFVSLPSMQLYVMNGQWVVLGLLSAGMAAHFAVEALFSPLKSRRKNLFLFLAAICLLFGWEIYQATPFFMLALLVAPTLSLSSKDLKFQSFKLMPNNIQIIVTCLMLFMMTLVGYLIFWLLLHYFIPGYVSEDKRYGVTLVNFKQHLWQVIHYFFTMRLPQMANLWCVNSLSPQFPAYICSMILVLGLWIETKNKLLCSRIFAILCRALLIGGGLFFLDIPALSQPGPGGDWQPNYSYMTSGAVCLGFIIVLSYFIRHIFEKQYNQDIKTRIALSGAAFSMFVGSYMVIFHFTLPQWRDLEIVQHKLKSALNQDSKFTKIILYPPHSSLQTGIGEYSWQNYGAPFYAKFLVRNVLDQLGYYSSVDINIQTNGQANDLKQVLNRETLLLDLSDE